MYVHSPFNSQLKRQVSVEYKYYRRNMKSMPDPVYVLLILCT